MEVSFGLVRVGGHSYGLAKVGGVEWRHILGECGWIEIFISW